MYICSMYRIAFIDNYDSFTYNLVHYMEGLDAQVNVMRNDAIRWEAIEQATHIALSPGPGIPQEAGELLEVIRRYQNRKPILGICLGMQAICVANGGQLTQMHRVFHGVATPILPAEPDAVLYQNIPFPIAVGRYHSWIVKEPLPDGWLITSRDEYGYPMSLKHQILPVHAVQYHPESILTPVGKQLIANWLNG